MGPSGMKLSHGDTIIFSLWGGPALQGSFALQAWGTCTCCIQTLFDTLHLQNVEKTFILHTFFDYNNSVLQKLKVAHTEQANHPDLAFASG
mmetsp:Transcript_152382/g.265989  ORF Transcript_152382/g.265989 Transcript_152382/m.265989 type:complete len:91 (+) Transcript_152382:359-631(+)